MTTLTIQEFNQAREDIALGLEQQYGYLLGRHRVARGMLKLEPLPGAWPGMWADWLSYYITNPEGIYALEAIETAVAAVRSAETPEQVRIALAQMAEYCESLREKEEAS